MTDLIRLVYASRATFKPGPTGNIDLEVARILMQSRRRNPPAGLVGALYYSNGLFFQCLEGSMKAVEGLYARLHDDPRHKDLKILMRQDITQLSFATWAMKYIPNAVEVNALLVSHGRGSFDPYSFDAPLIDAMVALLACGADAAVPEPASSPASTSAGSNKDFSEAGLSNAALVRRSNLALTVASLALVVALAALAVVLLRSAG
jgi:hypothetical protein